MAFAERIRGFLPHLRYEGPQACCSARVITEVADGISRRENPQQIAERLKRIEGVTAGIDELREGLLREQVLSEIVSVGRLNEIVAIASHKTSSIQNVLNLLRGVHTTFDVDRVIAREGGINALGFSRIIVSDVLPGKEVRPTWQWAKKDDRIEECPTEDSELPTNDHSISIPGNGNIFTFVRESDRPIHQEDIDLLQSLINAGVETKHRIKSERRVRNELISQRTRELISRRAGDRMDLMKILLIAVTYHFHVNMASIFMRVPRTNKFEGVFGLGSLTEKEHIEALQNLSGVRTEEDVLGVVKSRRNVDSALNQLMVSLAWEGELKEAVIARDGRFYNATGKEYETPPPIAEYLLGVEELPAKDFVILPVKTSKTTYGFLYLANPWTGRDIDLDGISVLSRDFIDLLRVMRRQTDPPAAPGGPLPVNRDQLLTILRRAFRGVSDAALAAKEALEIINAEAREAKSEDEIREIFETWREWLGMPEGLVRFEMGSDLNPLMEKEWIGAVLGSGLIEALQAMRVGFNHGLPGLCYGEQDWILIKSEGDTVIFEIFDEKMGGGMGMEMLKALDAELREQKVGGIRFWVEGPILRVRFQNLGKK